MTGALWFVVIVLGVVFWGTLLLQGAILLLQLAIWAAVWTARVALGLAGLLYMSVWWLIDREAAEQAWRQAPHPPAGYSRRL